MGAKDPKVDVKKLRTSLKLTRPAFARLVGVDFRTVIRWEKGDVVPQGAALAVMLAFRTCLADRGRAKATRVFARQATQLGGLGSMLLQLLEFQNGKKSL
jgi:DNA-binding XRE family transcriptional regulator